MHRVQRPFPPTFRQRGVRGIPATRPPRPISAHASIVRLPITTQISIEPTRSSSRRAANREGPSSSSAFARLNGTGLISVTPNVVGAGMALFGLDSVPVASLTTRREEQQSYTGT